MVTPKVFHRNSVPEAEVGFGLILDSDVRTVWYHVG
jgi:hypothetical protein